jgi:hypothetical protein
MVLLVVAHVVRMLRFYAGKDHNHNRHHQQVMMICGGRQ